MKRVSAVSVSTILALGMSALPALADVTFTGTSGSLAAKVVFAISGSNLVVTLTNTSAADVVDPAQVLTAVFFDLPGNPSLGSSSAVLAAGSSVINVATASPAVLVPGGTDPGGVVGGEWGYGTGLSGTPGGAKQGISSTGLNQFGGATFPGNNLQDPAALDGVEYGITSAGDNPATGNGGITTQVLIKNSVVFTLSGLPAGFNLSGIGNVTFQYGTSLTEPSIPGLPPEGNPVPSPTASVLGLIGLVCVAVRRSAPIRAFV